jgi:hypothetical protein
MSFVRRIEWQNDVVWIEQTYRGFALNWKWAFTCVHINETTYATVGYGQDPQKYITEALVIMSRYGPGTDELLGFACVWGAPYRTRKNGRFIKDTRRVWPAFPEVASRVKSFL